MRFAEAEQTYRELEERLVRGEITEDEFTAQVAKLRLVDEECRRWMISPRTGRWLVYDGQQWVFAEPAVEKVEPEPEEEWPETEVLAPVADAEATIAAPVAPIGDVPRRSAAPRILTTGVLALLLVGCLIGGGISAWVFLLRDWGATPTPVSSALAAIGPVETYTPRPATATFTPTASPTPSRTPTPTITPIPTDTPPATNTPTLRPTSTRPAEAANTPGATEVAAAPTAPPAENSSQTHVVQKGETLSEIASRYGLTVKELAEANGIDNPALVRVGQVLLIPAPGASASPTPTWTPIVLITPAVEPTASGTAEATPPSTVSATPTPTSTSQATAPSTPTESGPTATPKPTNTPKPTATPTPKPVALSGKIAFSVWNPHLGMGKYELYVSNIDGSGRNMLGQGFRQPQFRQDGNLLAANGDGAPNLEHLVTMDASGNGKVEVSNHTEDAYPTWSADGAIVAYSSKSWADRQSRLGIVHDMFGKNQDSIKIGTTEIRGEYPFWMADGRVVYHGCDFMNATSACGLYWVGAGGGNYYRLTNHQSDTAPAGSGSRVAFMSARDGNWEVYAINMDGSGLKRLTNNGSQDGLPTWSPDGNSIAFVSDRSGAWAIWVMNANGSNQRKLFDLGGGYGGGDYDWTTERISWAP